MGSPAEISPDTQPPDYNIPPPPLSTSLDISSYLLSLASARKEELNDIDNAAVQQHVEYMSNILCARYGFVPNACNNYRYQSDEDIAEICRYLWDTWYKLTKSSGLHNESICLG